MEDKVKNQRIIRQNPWLREMWNEASEVHGAFFRKLTEIEKKYQKMYGLKANDVFFAFLHDGELIGIDWKNCRTNKKGALLHDSELDR